METVNIHEAKTHLSRLIERILLGEEIIIAKAGNPIARLVPYTPPKRRIVPPGAMKGEIWIADDFDAPVNDMFECLEEGSSN